MCRIKYTGRQLQQREPVVWQPWMQKDICQRRGYTNPHPLKGSFCIFNVNQNPMSKDMHRNASNILFQRAKELRNNETKAEEILWSYLRTKPFQFKFRRQHPYFQYIFDFYC